jgi:uncharacterized protein (UPF0128 family)
MSRSRGTHVPKTNAYRSLAADLEKGENFKHLSVNARIILKWIFKKED